MYKFMVKYYKTPSVAIQFTTVGQLFNVMNRSNYLIFEIFVGLKSKINNILVTKSVVYVKPSYIQQLLEEHPLPVPL